MTCGGMRKRPPPRSRITIRYWETEMMKPFALALLAALLFAAPVRAETFEEAVALYSDKDYKAAFQVAKPLAEGGDARAMAMLGTLYQNGLGVKKDLSAAVKWLTQAAEQNNAGAQFALAVHHLDDASGKPNLPEAEKWMERAASNGSIPAQHNMGLLAAGAGSGEPDWPRAKAWFQKAADK